MKHLVFTNGNRLFLSLFGVMYDQDLTRVISQGEKLLRHIHSLDSQQVLVFYFLFMFFYSYVGPDIFKLLLHIMPSAFRTMTLLVIDLCSLMPMMLVIYNSYTVICFISGCLKVWTLSFLNTKR